MGLPQRRGGANVKKIMKIKVDEKADALYIRIDDSKIIESEEVTPGVIVDFNENNQVVGVEILNLSKRSSSVIYHSIQYEIA